MKMTDEEALRLGEEHGDLIMGTLAGVSFRNPDFTFEELMEILHCKFKSRKDYDIMTLALDNPGCRNVFSMTLKAINKRRTENGKITDSQ